MSDLISRQAVLDKLKDFSDMYTLDEEAKVVLDTIVRVVTEQPTAYDVEKVVAEVDELWKLSIFGKSELNEIIRKGGVE